MSAHATSPPRSVAPLALLLILPLLGWAAWHYDLAASIASSYVAMVAAYAVFQGALALAAWWLQRRGERHSEWLVAFAALPMAAGLLVFAGPVALAAGGVLALAALAAGTTLAPAAALPVVLLSGLALVAATVGWLLPLPIHHRWLYGLVAATLVAARWRPLEQVLRTSLTSARNLATQHPCACIVAVAALGLSSLGLWLPSLNYDDNALHLILQAQLLAEGRYAMDVQRQAWALMPWANNVLHAVAAVLAGSEARAAMAGIWLLVGADGARRLALALDASPATALLAAAVFAAQPFAGYFTTTMQVDGASAAVLLQLAAIAVLPFARRPGPLAIGAMAGLLLGLKTVNLLFVLPLVVAMLATTPPGARGRWALRVLTALLPVAAPSYVYALALTGNPLFPMFNAVFQSPLYPLENFRDTKWMAGVTWSTPWDLAFHAQRFGQYYAGASGLAVLATLPAVLVAALRDRRVLLLAAWAVGCAALLFFQMQYLRYLFPMLAVLVVLGIVAWGRLLPLRAFAVAATLLVAADLLLMPTTSWIVRENPWSTLLQRGPAAESELVAHFMPERALLEDIMSRNPNACVLMADPTRPFVGAGRGRAMSVHRRYDPASWRLRQLAEDDKTGVRWSRLLAALAPSHVVASRADSPVLASVLDAQGWPVGDTRAAATAWARPDGRSDCARGGEARLRSAVRFKPWTPVQ